jgi:hypothetical protein
MDDEFERARIYRDARPIHPLAGAMPGSSAFVGQVSTPTPAANTFISMNPTTIGGGTTVGSHATFTSPDPTASVGVLLIGDGVPSYGEYLLARFVDYRWVTERMSGAGSSGGVTVPGCPCAPVPTTLSLVNNYLGNPLYPELDATLTYYPTAATSPVWLGQAWVGPNMDGVCYTLFCIEAVYSLVYGVFGGVEEGGPTPVFGEDGGFGSYSPSESSPNTCTPLSLSQMSSDLYPPNLFTITG